MRNANNALEFSIRRARKAQTELAKKVISEDQLPKEIKFVTGVDAAYLGDWAFGATVVLDYQSLRVLETQTAKRKALFSYVPTLLSFRELPLSSPLSRSSNCSPTFYSWILTQNPPLRIGVCKSSMRRVGQAQGWGGEK